MGGDEESRRPTGGNVPDWARFFERDQFGDFLARVRETLDELGVSYEVNLDEGLVEVESEETETRILLLSNLIQMCRGLSRDDWSEAIAGQIGHLLEISGNEGELLARFGEDFEEARPYLKVRLIAEGLPNEDMFVIRRPMEGVISILVYDLPDAIATVPRDHVTNWGMFDDELFELALGRVRDDRPDREEVEIDEGVQASILAGESYFSATHALLMGEYLPADARNGALVSIPHRHLVLFHPIRDERVIPALNRLVQLTHAMHAEGPGAISESVFWFDGRRFVRIPSRVEDDSVEIFPPRDFVEMLNGLVA